MKNIKGIEYETDEEERVKEEFLKKKISDEKIRTLIDRISYLFCKIQNESNSWYECHEGFKAIIRLKPLLGIPEKEEHRHNEEIESEEDYYKRIKTEN